MSITSHCGGVSKHNHYFVTGQVFTFLLPMRLGMRRNSIYLHLVLHKPVLYTCSLCVQVWYVHHHEVLVRLAFLLCVWRRR